MAEAAIKQRMNRAIKSAIKCLNHPKGSHETVLLGNGPFHIEAIREKEIRKIRIVLDRVTAIDEKEINAARLPSVCTKEIWCKKQSVRGFEIRDFD